MRIKWLRSRFSSTELKVWTTLYTEVNNKLNNAEWKHVYRLIAVIWMNTVCASSLTECLKEIEGLVLGVKRNINKFSSNAIYSYQQGPLYVQCWAWIEKIKPDKNVWLLITQTFTAEIHEVHEFIVPLRFVRIPSLKVGRHYIQEKLTSCPCRRLYMWKEFKQYLEYILF